MGRRSVCRLKRVDIKRLATTEIGTLAKNRWPENFSCSLCENQSRRKAINEGCSCVGQLFSTKEQSIVAVHCPVGLNGSRTMVLKVLAWIWTSPNTLLGLAFGIVSLCFGTKAQRRAGCIEFFGGPVSWFLNHVPPGGSSSAMTLGHVILGLNPKVLEVVRKHEQVHVRQYERWGPFFLPAYLGCSAWLWVQKRDPYLENPFEVEAYRVSDPRVRL